MSPRNTSSTRQCLIVALLGGLTLSAGCIGFLTDGETTGPESLETEQRGSFDGDLTRRDGSDLRGVAVPQNGSLTVSGELDRFDPVKRNRSYEPIEFPIRAGRQVNITMESSEGEPALRLVNPDGETIVVTTSGGSGTAQITQIRAETAARYTIEATSAAPNTTFNYTLTVERDRSVAFGGPPSSWNEREKYLDYTIGMVITLDSSTRRAEFKPRRSEGDISVNTAADYIVVNYTVEPGMSRRARERLDSRIALAYAGSRSYYVEEGRNSSTPRNENWSPELVFFRAVTPDGELLRASFVTTEWADYYNSVENGGIQTYLQWHRSTFLYGPAHPQYVEEDNRTGGTSGVGGSGRSMDPGGFPGQQYHDFLYDGGPKTVGGEFGIEDSEDPIWAREEE